MFDVVGLDHLVLRCADVDASLRFYVEELGLAPERVDEWRRGEAPFPSVRIDSTTIIDLFGGDADVADRSQNLDHFCLVVDGVDLGELAASGRFEVVDGPGPRWGAQGTGTSLYVKDPDGTVVELRTYGRPSDG